MTNSDLQNSMMIIGPACVGKSLISTALSKQTGIKKISVDDIKNVVQLEMSGRLSPDEDSQEEYIESTIYEIREELGISEFRAEDEEYARTEKMLVREIVDAYNYYRELFGGLEQFYSVIEDYFDKLNFSCEPEMTNLLVNKMTTEVLKIAFKSLEEPVIVDAPAPYGFQGNANRFWRMSDNVLQSETNAEMSKVLQSLTVILLSPGEDYDSGNAESTSRSNQILLSEFGSYEQDYVDVSIDTFGLFADASNPILKRRTWYDVDAYIKKQELLNQKRINEICGEILESTEQMQ